MDVKDLQYTVVKSRSQAIALITDIYNAEAKAMIKQLKEIENRPFNTDITYKPLNIDKVKNVQVPELKRVGRVIQKSL